MDFFVLVVAIFGFLFVLFFCGQLHDKKARQEVGRLK